LHTFSNFNIATHNNLKKSLPHIFSNLNVESLKLKNTLSHLKTYNTLKKSLPHTFSNLNVESLNNLKNTPPHLKSCKLFVSHHLEMNSHSLCKLRKNFLSKGLSPSSMQIQTQNPSLRLVSTQLLSLTWCGPITYWK
jgi:hypothetical protein